MSIIDEMIEFEKNLCSEQKYIAELEAILDVASKLETRRIKRIAELEAENESLKKDCERLRERADNET